MFIIVIFFFCLLTVALPAGLVQGVCAAAPAAPADAEWAAFLDSIYGPSSDYHEALIMARRTMPPAAEQPAEQPKQTLNKRKQYIHYGKAVRFGSGEPVYCIVWNKWNMTKGQRYQTKECTGDCIFHHGTRSVE